MRLIASILPRHHRLLTARRLLGIASSRRCLASDESSQPSSTSNAPEWRQHQLNKLQSKFEEPLQISSDEELQPMWKEMESRVTRRRSLTLEQRGGKSGRANIRKTDEEAWLQAGLYDEGRKETDEESTEK